MMTRRTFLGSLGATLVGTRALEATGAGAPPAPDSVRKITKSNAEWRQLLRPEQYTVLREEGTERPGTSPFNDEHRKGSFVCAGCELALFTSEMKFDSGTGWPS